MTKHELIARRWNEENRIVSKIWLRFLYLSIATLILLLAFSITIRAQSYVKWSTSKESQIVSYDVEVSNNLITWSSIANILPNRADSNSYQIVTALSSIYVHIKANTTLTPFYTQNIYIYSSPLLLITPQESTINLL